MIFQLFSGIGSVYAVGDSTAPTVSNIELSPSNVVTGGKVKVTAEVTDDISGVKNVAVYFKSPSKSSSSYSPLYYNETSGLYEGTLTVDKYAEEGKWTLYFIGVGDKAGNDKNYQPNELPNEIFYQVTNELGDKAPPVIESIEVSEQEVGAGEVVKVKANVTDDISGVKNVAVYFKSPSKSSSSYSPLYYNETSGLYEGTLTVDKYAEEGKWTLYFIGVGDKAGNDKNYQPYELTQVSKTNSYVVVYKPSDLDSPELNDPQLPYAITTKNETLSNRIIEKDLYIGPNSTISIDGNVTITGNVYVYGTLISHGGLTIQGSLNAKTVTYGSNTSVSPGAVRFVGGQNSIPSTIVSNQAYKVPFTIKNKELTNETGTAILEGKTLPFLDVSLQENPISLGVDGSFTTTAEDITSEGLQFNLRDVFGNNMKKDLAVKDVLPPAEVVGLTVSKTTHNEAQVSWNASTDSDLKKYALYLNGELVSTLPPADTAYLFGSLKEGTVYEVAIAAIDIAGNESEVVKANATTLLSKPSVDPVSDKSLVVTGQSSPGTTVTVYKGESIIGSGKTDLTGKFIIEIPAQKAGTELTVTASNEAGIDSKQLVITVEDITAPAKPAVNAVSDKDLAVSGTAEANTAIAVKAGDKVVGEGTTDELGKFSIAIAKQQAGIKLSVTATDSAGNISEAKEITVSDLTAPQKPAVDKVTDKTISITGTAEAGSVVSVKAGTSEIGKATVNLEGKYAINIQKQQAGTILKVTATDKAGNISQAAQVTVLDATAPAVPTVEEVTDKSTIVKGSAEAGSLISIKVEGTEIGKATTSGDGNFNVTISKQKAGTKLSVTATDAAGNVSGVKAVTVLDATAPAAPTVDKVTDKSTVITGSGEVNALITIKAGSTELGKAAVTSDGKYKVTIAVQKVGTKIQVTATDTSGNTSTVKEVTVTDGTAPAVPTVNEVTDKSTTITGTAEVAAHISVKAGSTEVGTATVDAEGNYSIAIVKQKAGTKLSVTAKDAAGNVSEVKEVIVLDVTAPSTPTVSKVTDQSTAVTGAAEAASQVAVKVGSKEVGKATVNADGTYSVTIPKQKAGTVLAVTATDKAGNISDVTEVTVVDGTPPSIELTSKVTHHSTRIIGTAEATSKIIVKAGTKAIGMATADAKGQYEVKIGKQKVGTKLSIVATDAAGNSSKAIPVTVVDGNYPDLKVKHWALDEIMYLADDQIIGGYPDGGFQPEKNTSRAEAAKMLALALDLKIEDVSSGYKDVPDKHWGKNYIAAVSKAGLFTGNPDGTFAPNDVLKRSEMAKVISIAYELKASDKNHFSDVKSGYWAKGYISGLYENGITTGYPDKTFHPLEPTTRAEYSVFLARAINKQFR
ncbi:Ig-like domain-containing protein [Planococcus sp. CPCC 101016]|uniref:Ig-like domain-containing protein n=1 Tax=Planococcus sp. CPCC 101016 TaxID=2599617 RepID=UPI001645B8BA|nr:Ig-like domain-containing protein [Planococcus sp. CPCC 101016]